ncbi:MAG: hypothetical protein MHMPM18_002472 [Marteilia pararefringens]
MSLRRSSRDEADFERNGACCDLELQIILDSVGGNGRGVKRCTIAPYSDFYEPSVCRQILKSPQVKTNGILKFMTTGAFKTINIPLMKKKSANENQSYDNLNFFDVLIRSFNRDFLIGTDNLAHLKAFDYLNIHLLDISDVNNGKNEIKAPNINKKSRFQNKMRMMNVKDTNDIDKSKNNMRIFRIASIELFDQALGDYCGNEERISYESSNGNFQYYFTFQCGRKEERAHLAANKEEFIKMIQVVRSRLSEKLQISVHTSLGLTYPLREYLAKNRASSNQLIVLELEEVEGKEAPDVDFWIFKRQESTDEFCANCVQSGGTENEDIKKVSNPNQEVKDMRKYPDLAQINQKLMRMQKMPLKIVVIHETGPAPISLTLAFIVFSLSMICFLMCVELNYIN